MRNTRLERREPSAPPDGAADGVNVNGRLAARDEAVLTAGLQRLAEGGRGGPVGEVTDAQPVEDTLGAEIDRLPALPHRVLAAIKLADGEQVQ